MAGLREECQQHQQPHCLPVLTSHWKAATGFQISLTSGPRRQILLSGKLIRASLQETSVCIIDAAALLGDHTGHPGWCSVYPRILYTSNTGTDKLENHPKGISDSTWTSVQKPRQYNHNCSLRKRQDSKWAPSTHTANWKDGDTLHWTPCELTCLGNLVFVYISWPVLFQISTWNYLNIIWDTSRKAQLASSHVSVCLSTYLRGVFRHACPASSDLEHHRPDRMKTPENWSPGTDWIGLGSLLRNDWGWSIFLDLTRWNGEALKVCSDFS